MGNYPADLRFELENNGSVFAGGKLKGKVLLHVRIATTANFLSLRFHGREVAEYRNRDHPLYKVAEIFTSEVVLHSYTEGSVAVGHYEYPFEVAIPSGLPGSQVFANGYNYGGVEYVCKVKLHRPGYFITTVKKYCDILLLDEPYETFPVPLFLGPVTTKMYTMGTKFDGTIMFAGRVNTSNACGHDVLQVNYAIHNESTTRVKALNVDLTVHFGVTAGWIEQKFEDVIFSKRIDAAGVAGVKAKQTIGDGEVDCNSLLIQLTDTEFGIDIPIGVIPSSYNGAITSVKFELSMTIITTCGSNNPTIRVPIIIHSWSRLSQVDELSPVPTGWTASMVPTSKVISYEPTVALAADYDTVGGLIKMMESNRWQEVNALKDWLSHSLNNINLLTPDEMFKLFKCIKGDSSIYSFCRALGEAMNTLKSSNKCTCGHISEAARAVRPPMKIIVCNLFSSYCTDRENAVPAFKAIKFTDTEISNVMMNYKNRI